MAAENLTVSELTIGETGTGTWLLRGWKDYHKLLASKSSCSFQVGQVKLNFFLRPLEKTFSDQHYQNVTYKYYSLWVEILSEERKLLLKIKAALTPPAFCQGQRYEFSREIESQLVLDRLSSSCDSKLLVDEYFICWGGTRIQVLGDSGEKFLGLPECHSYGLGREDAIKITLSVNIMHFPQPDIMDRATLSAQIKSESNLIGDLEAIIDNSDVKCFHDMELEMKDGILLPAHRLILSARSSVFRAMFSSGMKESNSPKIDIPDIDSDAMKLVLKYMYTDKIGEDWKNHVGQVVYAANKYNLPEMLKFFDENMIKICIVGNAIELFKVAKLYSLKNAMKFLTEFTKSHTAEVLLSIET